MKRRRDIIIVAFIAAVMVSAGNATADLTFGHPTVVLSGGVNPSVSADGLEMYFVMIHPDGHGGPDIWVTRRATKSDEWGPAVNLGPPVNTSACDSTPSISADGLELYFADLGPYSYPYRPGGHGGGDIWVAKRKNKDENWSNPVNLGPTINTSSMETYPNISADGLSLYFSRGDIFVTTRATKDDDWDTPVNVGAPPNTSSWDGFPNVSADGRVLFFYSDRSGGYGGMDMYVTMRGSVFDSWGPPRNLGPMINTSYYDISPDLSADGSILYFGRNDMSGWGGTWMIYETVISPAVDFNGDGIVDAADICIMLDHWGTDEPLCDIGPKPWGDGVVDVNDLIVLADHFEIEDSRLIARWGLDEQAWRIAYDSVGNHGAILNGDPIWQPAQGKLNGALQFDGIDDYMSTSFILDPTAGPFSLLAWIKGGEAGRVILSQAGSFCDWLVTDPTGKLKTTLPYPLPALASDWVITDGVWHHIGLVCDASSTILYVDGAEAARNNAPPILPAQGGLYIGAGRNLEPRTYWTGLIDDIRIYNVALSAEEIEALAR